MERLFLLCLCLGHVFCEFNDLYRPCYTGCSRFQEICGVSFQMANVVQVAEEMSGNVPCRVESVTLVGESLQSYAGPTEADRTVVNGSFANEGQYHCASSSTTYCVVVLSIPRFTNCDNDVSREDMCIGTMFAPIGSSVELDLEYHYNDTSRCFCPLEVEFILEIPALEIARCDSSSDSGCIVSDIVMARNTSTPVNNFIVTYQANSSQNFSLTVNALITPTNRLGIMKTLRLITYEVTEAPTNAATKIPLQVDQLVLGVVATVLLFSL